MRLESRNRSYSKRKAEAGMALIETVIALGVLLTVATGVMALAAISMTTTENQGHLQARTAEYAQDKMEQLLGLAYCDASTDTTILPASSAGGTGLAGCAPPLVNPQTGTGGVGGSSDPANPVVGYVDYLDTAGNLVVSAGGGAPAGWYYKRVWQISLPAGTTNLKQIAVTVQTKAEIGAGGALPRATVTALKTFPF
jgi:type II secretory pathway pseudopilin PulG